MNGIDRIRQEKRFFLPGDCLQALAEVFEAQGFITKPSTKGSITHTIYFLDDEQTVSVGASFKARRYLTCFSESLDLNQLQNITFRCEIKKEARPQEYELREKIDGGELSFRDAESLMNKQAGFRLRPYLAVEYLRTHFVRPGADEKLRVTVDTGAHFWFFPPGQGVGILVGDAAAEKIVRTEIKFDPNATGEIKLATFLDALIAMGALPAISKKAEGLNFAKWWHDRKYAPPGMVNELGEFEIEAKLSLEGFDFDALLVELRAFARGGGATAPIIPDAVFPYLLATTTVNHYWAKKDVVGNLVEGSKVLARGGVGKINMKADSKMLDARLGIIERKEVKGRSFPYPCRSLDKEVSMDFPAETLAYVGHLLRIRKAFWLINPQNRLYHVSLERCVVSGRKPLDQIEIEYTGLRKQGDRESDRMSPRDHVLADITWVAEKVLSFMNGLGGGRVVAMGVEKFAWLMRTP